jgi:hypothetical protein
MRPSRRRRAPARTIKIGPRLVFGKPSLLLFATNAADIDADAEVDAPVGGEPAAGTRRLTSASGTFETCRLPLRMSGYWGVDRKWIAHGRNGAIDPQRSFEILNHLRNFAR